MVGKRMIWGMGVCVLVGLALCQGLGQVRGRPVANAGQPGFQPPVDPRQLQRQMQAEAEARRRQYAREREQRREQFLREAPLRARETERVRDEGIRQALGASQQQWQAIQPRYNRVRNLMREARFGLVVLGFTSESNSGGSSRSSGTGTSTFNSGGSAGFSGASAGGGGMYGGGARGGGSAGAQVGGEGWKPVESALGNRGAQRESGWKWSRPSEQKSRDSLTRAERAAETLLDGLEKGGMSTEELDQRVSALRAARVAATEQLVQAQKQLREVLSPEQEAVFVLMGYLD